MSMDVKSLARPLILIPFSLVAFGQPPSANTGFDVISIRRDLSGSNGAWTPPLKGGRLIYTNASVKDILSIAYYPIPYPHILGGPDWISRDRFDIQAVTTEPHITQQRYNQLLRQMLKDRFHLKAHVETKEGPVYALIPDKKGLKLKTTPPSECSPIPPGELLPPNGTPCGRAYGYDGKHFEGIGMTSATLAAYLSLMAGRPVIDRIGFTGMFDVKLDFTAAKQPVADPDGPPSIFDALPAQLGLRLQPEKGPVTSLVVDSIERPSAN